ncbi:MAG: ABC transporter ATP-binding protein [Planctomycetota bacterium]|nr:ABC transporter ATP-binding protein [Planctomycetota bacterium]
MSHPLTAEPAAAPPPQGTHVPAPPAKVRLRGVTKTYARGHSAERFAAVQDVELEIREGEFLALVGPSGCGKSTLLNLIAGFETPDEGEVLVEGTPVAGAGPDRLVIFQEHGLFPWLTVLQNVEFGMKVRGVPKAERRERALQQLKLVHLTRFQSHYPFQLSGGMKQRAAIARALAVEPQMLLMDEPFAALDPSTRDILHAELQSLWMKTRKTVVFVTHSVEEAVRLADRVVVMASQPGRIRRTIEIGLPHPRQFLDPALAELRASILAELQDELTKIMKREGDDDWHLEEGALRRRPGGRVDHSMGDGI